MSPETAAPTHGAATISDKHADPAAKHLRRTGTHSRRVIFIDLARAIAVLFMLYGHTIDALLAPEFRSGLIFNIWQFQRGLTSCLFLLLSGFAFSIATARHWTSHLSLSPALVKRIRRFLFFIGLGYTIRLPLSPVTKMATASDDMWRALLGVDVLHLIGVTFLAVQLLVLVSRSRRVFSGAALVLAFGLVLIAPAVWTADWSARLPMWMAAYMSPATGSLFPLVPWSAFILIGAALGQAYAHWGASHHTRYANLALILPGLAAVWLGLTLTRYQVELFGSGDFAFVPGNMILRGGVCVIIIGVVAHASRAIAQLPHVFGAVAQESLLVYALHLFIVYGSVWGPGLYGTFGTTRTPAQLLLIVVVLISSMSLVAYAWNWLKHAHGRVARWTTVAVALLLLSRFFI